MSNFDRLLFCVVAALMLGCFGALAYEQENRLRTITTADETVTMVATAQAYAIPLAETVGRMTGLNAELITKLQKAQRLAHGLHIENGTLKDSLNESIELLKEQIDANNQLMEEIRNMTWRLNVLQKALDAVGNDAC